MASAAFHSFQLSLSSARPSQPACAASATLPISPASIHNCSLLLCCCLAPSPAQPRARGGRRARPHKITEKSPKTLCLFRFLAPVFQAQTVGVPGLALMLLVPPPLLTVCVLPRRPLFRSLRAAGAAAPRPPSRCCAQSNRCVHNKCPVCLRPAGTHSCFCPSPPHLNRFCPCPPPLTHAPPSPIPLKIVAMCRSPLPPSPRHCSRLLPLGSATKTSSTPFCCASRLPSHSCRPLAARVAPDCHNREASTPVVALPFSTQAFACNEQIGRAHV